MSAPQSIRVVGGVVSPALLAQLQDGTVGTTESRSAQSYHLAGSESVRDAAPAPGPTCAVDGVARADARPADTAGTGPAANAGCSALRELGYGQLPSSHHGITVDDVTYPVSHSWQHVPIHLLGPGVDLDKRNPGVAGAARAPQAMVQELLNRSDLHLWAILSNGMRLRLLRDSTALVGSAYVEFDLEAIFDGELYAEWLLLYQLVHVSRLPLEAAPRTTPPPADSRMALRRRRRRRRLGR